MLTGKLLPNKLLTGVVFTVGGNHVYKESTYIKFNTVVTKITSFVVNPESTCSTDISSLYLDWLHSFLLHSKTVLDYPTPRLFIREDTVDALQRK